MSERSADALVGHEGEVKWFDAKKGFGFIIGPDEQDIFVHFSVIQGGGYRVLRDGAVVDYDAERTDKGWRATRVERRESIEVPRHAPRTPRRAT